MKQGNRKDQTEVGTDNKRDKEEEETGGNKENVKETGNDKRDMSGRTEEDKGGLTVKETIKQEEDHKKSTEDIVKTGNKAKKIILLSLSIILVLIGISCCVYTAISLSYKEKFLPGTWVNGIDCSELSGAQAAGLLQDQLRTYYLEVFGREHTDGTFGTLLGQITAEDISLTYSGNSGKEVEDLLAEQNILTWMYRKLSDETYFFHISQGVSYDEEKLRSIVYGWEACKSGNMTEPRNAYISEYSDELNGYEIIPEVEGTKFNVQDLLELMDMAILSQETYLDLETAGCYEEPDVRQDAAELTKPVEMANKWLGTRITYDWNGTEIIVDAELLKDWITMEKDGPVLDETAVAAFVKEQAKKSDTYGNTRSFTTTLGVELFLRSGYYGWLTDKETETEELIKAIQLGKTVAREPVYASTAMQKGTSDIGSSYVEVDLTHQHLYLYEEGEIIFETDFVSGSMSSTPDCITPEGVFGLSYKTTNAVLRGATYETPVNYWMPFYGNYGLHDATWRSEFGGQIFITNGSHGCVNLPLSAAATIYEHVSAGFPVICYYYQVDPLAGQQEEDEWNGVDYNDSYYNDSYYNDGYYNNDYSIDYNDYSDDEE